MAKKNNKKLNKLDKWLPICAVGGAVLGSILSIALENVIYLIFGSCMGLMIGVILGADEIENMELKQSKAKKQTTKKKQSKTNTKTKKK